MWIHGLYGQIYSKYGQLDELTEGSPRIDDGGQKMWFNCNQYGYPQIQQYGNCIFSDVT